MNIKMSDSFNKNFAIFLTSCRESALKELADTNAGYKKLLADMAEVSKKIQNALPDEYDILMDTVHALTRTEINYLYLQGYKDCVTLCKIFNSSFMESKDFEKFFI